MMCQLAFKTFCGYSPSVHIMAVRPDEQRYQRQHPADRQLASVNALQNVDGTKMVVFGKDKAGKAAAGVLTYPTSATSGFTVRTMTYSRSMPSGQYEL